MCVRGHTDTIASTNTAISPLSLMKLVLQHTAGEMLGRNLRPSPMCACDSHGPLLMREGRTRSMTGRPMPASCHPIPFSSVCARHHVQSHFIRGSWCCEQVQRGTACSRPARQLTAAELRSRPVVQSRYFAVCVVLHAVRPLRLRSRKTDQGAVVGTAPFCQRLGVCSGRPGLLPGLAGPCKCSLQPGLQVCPISRRPPNCTRAVRLVGSSAPGLAILTEHYAAMDRRISLRAFICTT